MSTSAFLQAMLANRRPIPLMEVMANMIFCLPSTLVFSTRKMCWKLSSARRDCATHKQHLLEFCNSAYKLTSVLPAPSLNSLLQAALPVVFVPPFLSDGHAAEYITTTCTQSEPGIETQIKLFHPRKNPAPNQTAESGDLSTTVELGRGLTPMLGDADVSLFAGLPSPKSWRLCPRAGGPSISNTHVTCRLCPNRVLVPSNAMPVS